MGEQKESFFGHTTAEHRCLILLQSFEYQRFDFQNTTVQIPMSISNRV